MITILQNKAVTDYILYELKDGDELLGSVSAKIEDGELVIFEVESIEEIFYDGLVRAVLAYADNRFVERARFEIGDARKRKRLCGFGFITEESNVLESIQEFFRIDSCK